jgi:Methyltransferase domain
MNREMILPRSIFITGLLLLTGASPLHGQGPHGFGFLYKNMKEVRKYCTEMVETLDLKPGDTIACIGAANGWAEVAMATLVDSVVFYLQDIDSTMLNQNELNKLLTHYTQVKGSPITCTFILTLGTAAEIRLPKNQFKKVWMMSVFHHIDEKWRFLREIGKIMDSTSNSQLFITEKVLKEGPSPQMTGPPPVRNKKQQERANDPCVPRWTADDIMFLMKGSLGKGAFFVRENHGAVTLIFTRKILN